MQPADFQRISITSAEAVYLTLGSWTGIAKGFEMIGYCHECDDMDATCIVEDYFLDLSIRCVTAEVRYKCCSFNSTVSYAVLDKTLLDDVMTMSRR